MRFYNKRSTAASWSLLVIVLVAPTKSVPTKDGRDSKFGKVFDSVMDSRRREADEF